MNDTPETDIAIKHRDMVIQQRDDALRRTEELEDAIRNLQLSKGRHGTQIAAERLFKLLPENQ